MTSYVGCVKSRLWTKNMKRNKSQMQFSSLSLRVLALAFSLSLAISGCGQEQHSRITQDVNISPLTTSPHSVTQTDIDNIAKNLDVEYRVVTNVPTEKCAIKISDGACFEVALSFTARQAIKAKNWSIYFSQISPVQSFESDNFTIKHLNGDLHQISLSETFSGFKQGETKTLLFRANLWMLSETDALPNYLVTASDLETRVIDSTKVVIDKDSGLELLPFVVAFSDKTKQFKSSRNDKTKWLTSQRLYQRNANGVNGSGWIQVIDKTSIARAIIPTPKYTRYDDNNAVVDISQGLKVNFSNVTPNEVDAALSRFTRLGLQQTQNGFPLTLHISKNDNKPIGSYTLTVADENISIIGVDTNGVFNGLQSLASLYSVGSNTLPVINVDDEPHYAFRGMLVDVARNFHSKVFILDLLDQMAAYKLNKLHLHLGDDEAWRLEIPTLPELTELSSKRCFDMQEQTCLISQLGAGVDTNSSVNGYYSVSDYTDILQAATARHIQVIPSLDMPGHSRAAMKAMTARYNKYQTLKDEVKAKQFLLDDFDDKTQYSSVQFYNDNTINVCLESSYTFIIEVMTQMKKIHQDAGQPLTRYHIGADETAGAWLESPACKDFVANNNKGVTKMSELGAYFIERVAGILSDLNIETAGWSDGMAHTRVNKMPAIVQANAWDVLFGGGHNKVHQLANRDWQIVISTPDVLYFDFPYEASPKEHGYYWASRHTNTEKVFQFMPDNLPVHAEFWLDRQDNIYVADDTKTPLAKGRTFLGIQGQLWSENTRHDEMAEHKIFPRLLALAERAWYLPKWAVPYEYQGAKYSHETQFFTAKMQRKRNENWRLFAHILGQKEFVKLELAGIDYRLPTVGAVIEQGRLKANIAFPGLVIEYQEGQSALWKEYHKPVVVQGAVQIRSRAINGLRTGRITQVSVR